MKRTTRKLAALSIAATISAATLTACSAGGGSDADSNSLNVAFWDYGPAAQANNKALAEGFEAANPGVTVELTPVAGENWGSYYANVATSIAAGNRPDLMLISGEGAQFVTNNDLILPINDYLENDPDAQAIQDGIAPGLIAGFTVDEQVVTLANQWNDMVVYYNTDVFAAAGLEAPSADWTWDDFEATAAALTKDTDGDGEPEQYGFTWASNEIFPGIMPWVANAGGNLTDDAVCTPTVDTPEVSEAVGFLNELIEKKIAPAPMPMSDVFTRFQNGTIAMFGAGRWPIGTFVPAGFTAFDIQLYPTGETYKTVFGGAGYPILKSSANPDLAWEFQKFTVSEDIQNAIVGTPEAPGDSIPSLRAAADTISEVGVPPVNSDLFYASIDDYDTLVPYPAPTNYSEYEAAVLRNLQLIFAGEVGVDEGLATMQGELESIVTCS
ncbi:sugar ABC transporter substrate-binding protein [Herbiconiux moechotypicola]|uniref:Sugar ABC transporter substrate-binding protein n=1 Tax=Herbiconiux moechotypicola TaxID=637393 RepID=A0ABN3DHF9_9MICO|nr:sugar ABC transporter substrate-binding protein [Herbiconiux moechotypicola]MCS5729646.1 sugar ABC transporter substrate-binding protein [Herbiconiux moechotypicola]